MENTMSPSRASGRRFSSCMRPLACALGMLAVTMPCIAWAQQASQDATASSPTAPSRQATKASKPAQAAKSSNCVDADAKDSSNARAGVCQMQEITVVGIAASIQSSMDAKRDSNDIIESISPEDLGKLPTASIAESLSHLSGLATQREDGRANLISIRGLSPDFTGTTLDGREQATIGENRGVDFDQYPAELINGVTVYKTPDATLVGQGLSGTIDLHTIRPLDFSKPTIAMNVRGEYTSNGDLNPGSGIGQYGHRASFSYVDQFLDHTLGVAIGVAQLDSPIQEKQYQAWWWSVDNGPAGIDQNWGGPHTPGMPDNVISQEGMQLRAQSQNQKRNGLITVLEWAPNEAEHSTLNLYYSNFDNLKYTNGLQWSSSPYNSISYSNVGVTPGLPYPLVTSGTMTGIQPILQNEYTHERDKLWSIGWNNQYTFSNEWMVTNDLSYSTARLRQRDAYLFSGLPDGDTMGMQFNTPVGDGYPDFNPLVDMGNASNLVFNDPDKYGYDGREEFDSQIDTIKAIRMEASHPLGWIFGDITFGADYSERVKTKHADVYFAWLNGNGSTQATYNPFFSAPISYLTSPTSLGYGGVGSIVGYDVLDALANQFYLTPENGAGDWSRNYSVTERVPLAYVKFDIDTTVAGIPLRGNAGVQWVHTNQSSTALQTNGNTLVGTLTGGAVYNKWLPSLNLVADLGDDQYLRFGLAKTMARGRIDDEKVASSAGVSQVTDGPQAGQNVWSGSGGNPQLRSYVAVGTDLSWEKYFGKASYVAVGVFDKNLLNYIYDKTILNYDFSGFTNNTPTIAPSSPYGSFTLPENGTGGRMQGLELSGALEGGLVASALEGFGTQANFSLTNSDIPTSSVSSIPGSPKTLPGLSRKVANLELYYERYGFSARIAERYRSSFTGEAVALFDQLGYTKILANKQTDLQFGYEFSEGTYRGLSLLLQVDNLTNTSDTTQQIAGLPNNVQVARPLEYDTWGRTVMFGINYKL